MRLRLVAVGRTRAGPERELVSDYVTRFDRTGRALSLGPLEEIEIETRKTSGRAAEAEAIQRALPTGAVVVALDERGRQLSSPDLAQRLGDWRDAGQSEVAFVIGGADGLDPDIVARADLTLSLGRMVWPHMLARVMLAEQLYRAASILAGSPYHRA